MTAQLRELIESLEERIFARTHRLEIAATLGEQVSAILNFDALLGAVVNQIKDSFDYYHAHIYLLDDKRERLVVAEGTGTAGATMKAQKHSIPLDAPTSLVARAARTAEVVRVDNVREAEDWLPNPLLPDTYSEMAVPIISEGQVVGVLDVQEDEIASLDEGDANLLRSLANQVAVAIRNARQFAEVEAALAEAHEIQRRYVEQAWDRTKVARKSVGRVQFSLGESTTLSEAIIANAQREALNQREPTAVTLNGQEDDLSRYHALVAPIKLQGVVVGDLQLHDIEPDRKWTEGELALIDAVVDQVAQAAETLRLLDETQERATREQLIGQISNKIRRAPDMETLLKVAVSELSRVLSPARTFAYLGSKATLPTKQPEIAEDIERV
jgi:GAF domain-containing protein